jgi:ubiquinone/menaquinone biosynthesis C-methylase UbiE
VLDIGCGVGDVSFLAATLVGPHGTVTGVDPAREPVAVATSRATAMGVSNAHFIVSDIASVVLPQPVDVAVGRLVLMYLRTQRPSFATSGRS